MEYNPSQNSWDTLHLQYASILVLLSTFPSSTPTQCQCWLTQSKPTIPTLYWGEGGSANQNNDFPLQNNASPVVILWHVLRVLGQDCRSEFPQRVKCTTLKVCCKLKKVLQSSLPLNATNLQDWLLTKLLISFLLSGQVRYSVTKPSVIHGERDLITYSYG